MYKFARETHTHTNILNTHRKKGKKLNQKLNGRHHHIKYVNTHEQTHKHTSGINVHIYFDTNAPYLISINVCLLFSFKCAFNLQQTEKWFWTIAILCNAFCIEINVATDIGDIIDCWFKCNIKEPIHRFRRSNIIQPGFH